MRQKENAGKKTILRCKARIIERPNGEKFYKGHHICDPIDHPSPEAKNFRQEVFNAFSTPGIAKDGRKVYKDIRNK